MLLAFTRTRFIRLALSSNCWICFWRSKSDIADTVFAWGRTTLSRVLVTYLRRGRFLVKLGACKLNSLSLFSKSSSVEEVSDEFAA